MATFQYLPFELHIVIAKLLNLRDSLMYAGYVFSHGKQLDLQSVWGADNTVALPDGPLLKDTHAQLVGRRQ